MLSPKPLFALWVKGLCDYIQAASLYFDDRSHPMAGIGPVPRGTRARLGPFITLTLLARSA